MMYKSQFQIVPYDWFCAPGSHMFTFQKLHILLDLFINFEFFLETNRLGQ